MSRIFRQVVLSGPEVFRCKQVFKFVLQCINIAGHIIEITGEKPGINPGFSLFVLPDEFLISICLNIKTDLQGITVYLSIQHKRGSCELLNDDSLFIRLPCIMASSNRGVIASAAKQSSIHHLDCFATSFLAKTIQFQILSHFLHLKINVYLGHKKHNYEFRKT